MHLSPERRDALFRLMETFATGLSSAALRRRMAEDLLVLMQADHFASYVWDGRQRRFVSRVCLNMSDDNLDRYEAHYQFRDPITPQLQR